MIIMLQGWLPCCSRHIHGGERVFIGDCLGPVCMRRARGLADLALDGRLFFMTVAMTARAV